MRSGAREPRWVSRLVVDAIHSDMLATHGGLSGAGADELLEAALARPRQRLTYEASADLASLAAAYAFGIARNHPYPDGNKRVAFVVMVAFLGLNGLDFTAEEADVVRTILALAAGDIDESALAEWVRKHVKERPRGSL